MFMIVLLLVTVRLVQQSSEEIIGEWAEEQILEHLFPPDLVHRHHRRQFFARLIDFRGDTADCVVN
eukprot:8388767-Heterocapsa_arctica.AAC.1